MTDVFKKTPRTIHTDDETGKLVKQFVPVPEKVKIEEEEDDILVHVPVSSTSEDRDGDNFTKEGLENLKQQYKTGEVAYYEDHGLSKETGFQEYAKSDMLGHYVDAYEKDDVLMAVLRPRKESHDSEELHPRNKETVDMIKQGLPVGFSVGFIPLDFDEKDEGPELSMAINKSDLMETSSVGIPSNSDAVTAGLAVAKGLSESGTDIGKVDRDKLAESIKNVMSEKQEDTENTQAETKESEVKEPEAQESSEESESKAVLTEEQVKTINDTVESAIKQHLEKLVDELKDEKQADTEEDGEVEEVDEEEAGKSAESGEEKNDEGLSDEEKTVSDSGKDKKIVPQEQSESEEEAETKDPMKISTEFSGYDNPL